MSDDSYFTDPWQTRQVLDPTVEFCAYESIIQMVFDHNLPDVAHIIMSNYTWQHSDLRILLPYYESVGEEFDEKLAKFQEKCEPGVFAERMRNHALLELPIYSKSIDSSEIGAESVSRVFHDPKEFLDDGSASEDELYKFVNAVLKETFSSIFTVKEIKKVLREPIGLIKTLVASRQRDDRIGKSTQKKLDYEIGHFLTEKPVNIPDFHEKINAAITNFLVHFALHTIRSHCFVNFGVDGELKFFPREMYQKALEDLRTFQAKSSKKVSVKAEKSNGKMSKPQSTDESSSDDDFCQIIEISPSKPSSSTSIKTSVKKEPRNGEKRKNSMNSKGNLEDKDFPEKHMLEDLDKADLPMFFKTKFRRMVEKNRSLRDEIDDYKQLIQLKITERKAKI